MFRSRFLRLPAPLSRLSRRSGRRARSVSVTTAGMVCALLLAFVAWSAPRPIGGIARINDEDSFAVTLPLRFDTGASSATATVQLLIAQRPFGASSFRIIADDCIEEMSVNGQPVSWLPSPACDYTRGYIVDLGPLLTQDDNTVSVRLFNAGGPGGLRVEPVGWAQVPMALLLIGGAWLLFLALGAVRWLRSQRLMRILVVCGIALRVLLVIQTPWEVRGYDTDGHIEYVRTMAEHWRIPDPRDGWQFYQPPLYYALAAVVDVGTQAAGFAEHARLRWLQFLSCFLACAVWWIAMLAGRELFPRSQHQSALLLYGAMLATAPGWVFAASRISNDALLYLWNVGAVACALRSLHAKRHRWLYGTALCIGFGMLTKGNALLLVPLLGTAVLHTDAWVKRLRRLVLCIGVAIVVGSLATATRMATDTVPTAMVGNAGNLHSGLRLETTAAHLTVFHPIEVLRHPFNDPWSSRDRRDYFWEYLFRSSFFGEFRYAPSLRPLAQLVLFFGMLCLPLCFYGTIMLLRTQTRATIVLLTSMAATLVGHLAFRIAYPFSSSQDFRYSTLILIPVAAGIAWGVQALPQRARLVACMLLAVFIAAQGMFLTAVALS